MNPRYIGGITKHVRSVPSQLLPHPSSEGLICCFADEMASALSPPCLEWAFSTREAKSSRGFTLRGFYPLPRARGSPELSRNLNKSNKHQIVLREISSLQQSMYTFIGGKYILSFVPSLIKRWWLATRSVLYAGSLLTFARIFDKCYDNGAIMGHYDFENDEIISSGYYCGPQG